MILPFRKVSASPAAALDAIQSLITDVTQMSINKEAPPVFAAVLSGALMFYRCVAKALSAPGRAASSLGIGAVCPPAFASAQAAARAAPDLTRHLNPRTGLDSIATAAGVAE